MLINDNVSHAYIPRRRRESAVRVTQVVPRKLVTRKHATAVDMYDQVNAFLSISKTQASDTACELVPIIAGQIARTFVKRSCFSISCPDGVITLMPGSGVLQGSPFIVHVWVHTFRRPMVRARGRERQWNPNRDLPVVKAPCGGPSVDLSLSAYADDTMKMYVISQPTPAKFVLYLQNKTCRLWTHV